MDLRGSIEVWTDTQDKSLSLYCTDDDEHGALGFKLDQRSAVLLFELTVLRLQQRGKT